MIAIKRALSIILCILLILTPPFILPGFAAETGNDNPQATADPANSPATDDDLLSEPMVSANEADPILVSSITLDQDTLSLHTGEQSSLHASILPEDASNQAVVWSSNDDAIATVDATGLVIAQKAGTATITAAAQDGSGATDTCSITVLQYVTEIIINEGALMRPGDLFGLNLSVLPADASNKGVLWSSNNEAIATVDQNGTITAIKSGKATITATAADGSGVIAECYAVVVDYEFHIYDNKAFVTKYVGTDTNLIIPAILQGYPVWEIGGFKNHDLTSVVISPGIESISSTAFSGCTSLNSITIPSSVHQIDSSSFEQCTNLVTIALPSRLERLSSSLFSGCTKLSSITIPNVNYIGTGAFRNCISLTEFTIPRSTYYLESSVFEGCTNLKTVWIESFFDTIGSRVFYGCSNLETVTMTGKLPRISEDMFSGCTSLNAISIPNGAKSIDNGAFKDCTKLSSVTIPYGVTRIGEFAFKNCMNLQSLLIPSSVTFIGDTAFVGCTNLTLSGYEGSYVQSYASEYGIPFVALKLVSDIVVDYTNIRIEAGTSIQLAATVLPSDAYNKDLQWDSTDVMFASVDSTGKVTGKYPGTTNIWVSSKDSSFINRLIVVTVYSKPTLEYIQMGQGAITLNPGESFDQSVIFFPSDAKVTSLTWQTNNPNVAIVSESGTITAIGHGVADISVTANMNLHTVCRVTVNSPINGIDLTYTNLTISVGQSIEYLKATVYPTTESQAVTWTSMNNAVATVSSAGIISGVGVGSTTIQASTGNGFTKSCTVNVIKAGKGVFGISLSKASVAIDEGKTLVLSAKVTPRSAQEKAVVWSTSNPYVASVDGKGRVNALTPGTAVITATASSGVSAQCSVTVNSLAVTQVIMKKTYLEVDERKTASLTASVLPKNARIKTVTWSSSDPSIATVSSRGKISTHKSGTVQIIATANNGVSAVCTLVVRSLAVTTITINRSALTIRPGRYVTLKATLLPRNTPYKTVTWASSDPSIATVSSKGKVIGVKPGTVTITAIAHNGMSVCSTIIVE